MSRSSVLLIIGIPWATAVAVVLMVTKIHANNGRVHWGLLGSACSSPAVRVHRGRPDPGGRGNARGQDQGEGGRGA